MFSAQLFQGLQQISRADLELVDQEDHLEGGLGGLRIHHHLDGEVVAQPVLLFQVNEQRFLGVIFRCRRESPTQGALLTSDRLRAFRAASPLSSKQDAYPAR